MIPIASSEEITIYCPEYGRFAFFNSPYPAHKLSTGVDVYTGGKFGDRVGSPIGGKVMQIKKVKAPKGRNFNDHGYDVVTVLKSLDNPRRVIKTLHIEPLVVCGDIVKPGQEFGTLIRSGYYGFSTAPHIHVEVRHPSDPLRVRGGFMIERLLDANSPKPLNELKGIVTRSTPEYSVAILDGVSALGVPCSVGEVTGILDGGIPYFGWLGVHFDSGTPKSNTVKLCGKTIAKVKKLNKDTCIADCTDFSFTLNDLPIGLSFYLYPRTKPRVLLIPRRAGQLKLERSSKITIEIE